MTERNRSGAGRGRSGYGSVGNSPRRNNRRPRGGLGLLSALGPVLYFPMMLFYLEFFFHIYMREGLKYLPICRRLKNLMISMRLIMEQLITMSSYMNSHIVG